MPLRASDRCVQLWRVAGAADYGGIPPARHKKGAGKLQGGGGAGDYELRKLDFKKIARSKRGQMAWHGHTKSYIVSIPVVEKYRVNSFRAPETILTPSRLPPKMGFQW